jgi:hypothetical protein
MDFSDRLGETQALQTVDLAHLVRNEGADFIFCAIDLNDFHLVSPFLKIVLQALHVELLHAVIEELPDLVLHDLVHPILQYLLLNLVGVQPERSPLKKGSLLYSPAVLASQSQQPHLDLLSHPLLLAVLL